jgi:hypothetical protein
VVSEQISKAMAINANTKITASVLMVTIVTRKCAKINRRKPDVADQAAEALIPLFRAKRVHSVSN